MPADDIYLPLHVGAEGKVDEKGRALDLGWVKDNTGIVLASSGFMNLCPYTKQTREQNTEFTIAPSDRFIFSIKILIGGIIKSTSCFI